MAGFPGWKAFGLVFQDEVPSCPLVPCALSMEGSLRALLLETKNGITKKKMT